MRIASILERLSIPAGVLMVVCYLGFAALHIWTIIVSYQIYGFVAAVISAALLGFAEIYWAFAFWSTFGIWNYYTLSVAGFLAVFGLVALLAWLSEHADIFGPQEESAD
jgi:hypothetical protein